MNAKRKKYIFNLVGASILVLWLLMIGLLIKKERFKDLGEQTRFAYEIADIKSPQSDWMEIYLKCKKVGYSVNHVSPVGDDYLIQEDIFLKMNLMGRASVMHAATRSIVGNQFLLKSFRFRMTSGVVAFQVSGRVEGARMHLEIGEGVARRSESIKLSGRPMIGSAMAQFFKGRQLEVGQSFKFHVFDPSTMAQKEMALKVIASETLVINSIKYDTFRLETEMWGQHLIFWLDGDGSVLKEEGFMGLTLVRSSAGRAPRGIEGSGGEDFYKLAAITVKRKLQYPDKLTYLKLKVDGLDESNFDTGILNNGRQRFQGGIIEIVQDKIPSKVKYGLPYPDRSGEMRPFLQPEFNIESDENAIIEKAREIAGEAKNPLAVAKKIMAWVYENIEKRPVITVPSALEVLKTRVGDCNEHAALLTALVRAAGIPARICVGLVYTRGMFFYHAWTESYVGKWISADATLTQMPVDVTHINLVRGGLDRQVEIIGLVGKLRLEVIDYRYD